MASDQTVQNAVFTIELGRGRVVVQWIVVVLGAIALAIWYAAAEFRGLEKREAQDMAQLARNIARGEGYTTSVIRPLSLWHLKTYRDDHQPHFEPHPDIVNPPVYPTLLAGIFRLAGPDVFNAQVQDQIYAPEQWLIVPFGQLCLLATIGLVFLWARQLFDRRVAITTGLLLLGSETLWAYSISGLPTVLLTLLLMGTGFLLFLADQRLNQPERDPARMDSLALLAFFGSAVLMGLCVLTRYSSFWLALPMALYAARALRRHRAVLWGAVYLGVVLLVIAPWVARNWQVSHSLFGLPRYDFFANDVTLRTYDFDFMSSWSVRSFFSRLLTAIRSIWVSTFRSVGTDICLFFFVVGLLYEFRRDSAARLRRFVVGWLLVGILAMAAFGLGHDRYGNLTGADLLVPLLPLIVVFGVAFFFLMYDRIQFRMRLTQLGAMGVFAVANIAPLVLTLLPPTRGPFPYPPYCAPYTRLLAQWFDADEVGVSDAPWSVAWYADRRCLWLPHTPEEFIEIHDFVAPSPRNTSFLFLTPYMLDRHAQSEILKGEFKPWSGIVRGQLPERFPLRAATLLPPDTDQILLADRPRWKDRPVGFGLGKSASPSGTATNIPSSDTQSK